MTEEEMVESLWSVKYGERVIKRSYAFLNFDSYGVPDGDLLMDFSFWILRVGSRIIVVDTGYDIPRRSLRGDVSVVPPPDGLRLLGIDPLEVDTLILTHYHYDHVGFLHLFGNARIIASRIEHDFWFAKRTANDLDGNFVFNDDLDAIGTAEREGRLHLVSETTDVTPAITLHQVGGHCPGELVVEVHTVSGVFILASDAAHFYDQIENGWPFRAFFDYAGMVNAFQFMNELARTTGATIVPGHDGRTRERFSPLPGPGGSIATVIA